MYNALIKTNKSELKNIPCDPDEKIVIKAIDNLKEYKISMDLFLSIEKNLYFISNIRELIIIKSKTQYYLEEKLLNKLEKSFDDYCDFLKITFETLADKTINENKISYFIKKNKKLYKNFLVNFSGIENVFYYDDRSMTTKTKKFIISVFKWTMKYNTMIVLVSTILYNYKSMLPESNSLSAMEYIIVLFGSVCYTFANDTYRITLILDKIKNYIKNIIYSFFINIFPKSDFIKNSYDLKFCRSLLYYTYLTFSVNLISQMINLICNLISYSISINNTGIRNYYIFQKIITFSSKLNVNNFTNALIENINHEKNIIINFISDLYNKFYIEGLLSSTEHLLKTIFLGHEVKEKIEYTQEYLKSIRIPNSVLSIESNIESSKLSIINKNMSNYFSKQKSFNKNQSSGFLIVMYLLLTIFFAKSISLIR